MIIYDYILLIIIHNNIYNNVGADGSVEENGFADTVIGSPQSLIITPKKAEKKDTTTSSSSKKRGTSEFPSEDGSSQPSKRSRAFEHSPATRAKAPVQHPFDMTRAPALSYSEMQNGSDIT